LLHAENLSEDDYSPTIDGYISSNEGEVVRMMRCFMRAKARKMNDEFVSKHFNPAFKYVFRNISSGSQEEIAIELLKSSCSNFSFRQNSFLVNLSTLMFKTMGIREFLRIVDEYRAKILNKEAEDEMAGMFNQMDVERFDSFRERLGTVKDA
jgi:hypothetical protein